MQIEGYWPEGLQVPGLINPSRPKQEQRLTRLINFKSLIELDDSVESRQKLNCAT